MPETDAPFIVPDWPAPPWVRALVTTRQGGTSRGEFASLNLATHVGDNPAAVRRNRAWLRQRAALPAEPLWLAQVHGHAVADCAIDRPGQAADAAIARAPGQVCAVMTADCLPILLCERSGRAVAALHAGWRGLAGGVIEQGVARLGYPADQLLAWLGPAIGPLAFEVGAEVRACFIAADALAATAFAPSPDGRWRADLYALARQRLERLGVTRVSGGGYCTFSEPARFFSYRRDGRTGRMASLIWIAARESAGS